MPFDQKIQKIGTQRVHVASQKKHQLTKQDSY